MSVNRIMITSSTIILIYIEHTLNYNFLLTKPRFAKVMIDFVPEISLTNIYQ